MNHKIVLVDDDRNIAASLRMLLESEGCSVIVCHDGEKGLQAILDEKPDLCLCDIKMPGIDGLELLTKLREKSSVPLIFLTSKDDEVDQVLGLRLGADDYITKPFSQRLLIERVKTLLRRATAQNSEPADVSLDHIVQRGDLKMDDERKLTVWKNEHINLTVTEYLLLRSLVASPGFIKSRDQLITAAYGENMYVDDRIIDTHIKRIRRKFRETDRSFDAIETLYGAGYRYKN